ncbi:helix-turn-helix domain-containing protein [Mucilaginibacter sp.]|jgi:AraC-like DNA-binding protein|uniref:helix-turn-helix domain-containing protein n=1 Tax=Mucilaginibacter sp. TaxID=1882438 RepID=UPI00356327ED
MKHYKSLSELHADNGFFPPKNPLFTVFHSDHSEKKCLLGREEFTGDFYMIAFKKLKAGVILFGRTKYDHACGSMSFTQPRQVIKMHDLELEEDGFLILFHEDFLNGDDLHESIRQYGFFDYEINEALHLSPREELIAWEIFNKMEVEYQNCLHDYGRDIILSNIKTMLLYAQRFYKRQFMNRKKDTGKMVSKFKAILMKYVADGMLKKKGMPSVNYIAEQMNISPGYLSDLLKNESGKTTLEHIHIYLMSEAKNLLKKEGQSVTEIAYTLGFDNIYYFSRLFKKEVGLSPTQYKKTITIVN